MPRALPRILFTTPILRHPPIGGPELRIHNSLKALAKVSELYVVSRVSLDALGGRRGLRDLREHCRGFYFVPSVDPWRRRLGRIRRLLPGAAASTESRPSAESDYRHVVRIAERVRADVLWLGYGNISFPLLQYLKAHSTCQVVFDTDSVWSRFVLRGLPYARGEAARREIEDEGRRHADQEAWSTRHAEITTAVSEIDAAYYRELAADRSRVCLFPNVVDEALYAPPPRPADLRQPSVLLSGSFFETHSPMVDAARWLLVEILPRLREKLPEAHLYLAGKGSSERLGDAQGDGVTVLGEIPSLLPFLCHADAVVVPLRFESGTRFKILEAGACSRPVVSTTLGAEGLPVEDGRHLLLADTPEAFAAATARVLRERELAHSLAENLRHLIRERFTVASLAECAAEILDRLLARGAARRT